MFSRFQAPSTSYGQLKEGIKQELISNLESKGVQVKDLEIELDKNKISLSLYINESSAE